MITKRVESALTVNFCSYYLSCRIQFLTSSDERIAEYRHLHSRFHTHVYIIALSSSESPTIKYVYKIGSPLRQTLHIHMCLRASESWRTPPCSIGSFSAGRAEDTVSFTIVFHSCPVRFFFPGALGCCRGEDFTASRKSLLLILRRLLTLLLFSF